jgi:hypothetical protein
VKRQPTDKELAGDLIGRAEAAKAKANAAVKYDGSTEAIVASNQVSNCMRNDADCEEFAKSVEKDSMTGALAGRAFASVKKVEMVGQPRWILQHAKDVEAAEAYADKADVESKRVVEERKEIAAALAAEKEKIDAAQKECDAKPADCKAKCEKADHYACTVLADGLWRGSPPKYAEADDLLGKACEAKVTTACTERKAMEANWKQWNAKLDGLWNAVVRAGDDIAQRKYLAEFARKNLPQTPKNIQGAKNIDEHVGMLIRDIYCPAAKDFTRVGGAADFKQRATAHCKDEPPKGTGVGGVEVTLTAQCNATYAITCP